MTVTVHFAVFPFTVLAVIVAVPAPTAFTVPFDTVATLLLLVDHDTDLSDIFEGVTFAVRADVFPDVSVRKVLFSVMPDGCIS